MIIFGKIKIMKKFFFAAAFGMSVIAFAQEAEKPKYSPPAGNAAIGDVYGGGLSADAEKKAVTPAALEKKLKKGKKLEDVAVKGKVTDVCEKKGCWLTIETEDNDTFFVKMKDYAFFVPTALKGKNVILEGSAEAKTISVDEQKHYAEDAKKPAEEIAKITKPAEEIRFIASGIKVVQ